MIKYEKKIELLKNLKDRIDLLEFNDFSELTLIKHSINMIFKKIVDEENVSYYLNRIERITLYPLVYGNPDELYERECWNSGKDEYFAVVDSLLEKIEFDKSIDDSWDEPTDLSNSTKDDKYKIKSNKIFIVHGRDEAMKLTVKDFIKDAGLDPVILHEQLDAGQTVIEKFLNSSKEVGFAIVLFSPDDEGKLKNCDAELQGRARQNVILEYGFFVGVLGRENTFALVKKDVELPNDMSGLIYNQYEGDWKITLLKVLRSKGYDIDTVNLLG